MQPLVNKLAAATLSLLVAACSGPRSERALVRSNSGPHAPSTTSPPVEPHPAQPAWYARPSGGAQLIALGTTAPALVSAEACRACHAPIVDEWAGSRHAQAWTNSIFQTEFQVKPQQWCVNCHAPTDVQQAELQRGEHQLADQGVNCATCHIRNGTMVSRHRGAASPHQTVAETSFGSPAYCANCHNFTFPVLGFRLGEVTAITNHPMQATVDQFMRGPYAKAPEGCMTCHGSRYNHGFAGSHDPAMLAAAIATVVCRDQSSLRMTVTNIGAGHNVPTGDIHRHINARVWRSSAPENLFEGFIGRRFEPADDGGKTTVWDSTLAPKRHHTYVIAEANLGGDLDEPINVQLDYVYVLNEFPGPRHTPKEPVTTIMFSQRQPWAAFATCAGPVR